MTPGWLAAAPSSACISSVRPLYNDPEYMEDGQWPPPPELPSLFASALASSASTLVELHDLPLVEPASGLQAVGLAALTRLRVLTLRLATAIEALPSTLLPASLEDLTLTSHLPNV